MRTSMEGLCSRILVPCSPIQFCKCWSGSSFSSFPNFLWWVRLFSLLYHPRMMDDDEECGAVGGMISRENRSTRGKLSPVAFLLPPIPHNLTRARTWVAAVEGQRLAAWLTAWHWSVSKCISKDLRTYGWIYTEANMQVDKEQASYWIAQEIKRRDR
jgi:hypothetical protein